MPMSHKQYMFCHGSDLHIVCYGLHCSDLHIVCYGLHGSDLLIVCYGLCTTFGYHYQMHAGNFAFQEHSIIGSNYIFVQELLVDRHVYFNGLISATFILDCLMITN